MGDDVKCDVGAVILSYRAGSYRRPLLINSIGFHGRWKLFEIQLFSPYLLSTASYCLPFEEIHPALRPVVCLNYYIPDRYKLRISHLSPAILRWPTSADPPGTGKRIFTCVERGIYNQSFLAGHLSRLRRSDWRHQQRRHPLTSPSLSHSRDPQPPPPTGKHISNSISQ